MKEARTYNEVNKSYWDNWKLTHKRTKLEQCHTYNIFTYSLQILNQFILPCPVLTVASWPIHRFLRRQIRWSGIPISKNFPQFVVSHTVKGISIVNEAEVDILVEFSYFFSDPTDVGNLISGSSAFSKSSLNIWKFMAQILWKPDLENFEHYFASVRWVQLCVSLNILWYCLSLGLEWKLTFSSFISCTVNWPFIASLAA